MPFRSALLLLIVLPLAGAGAAEAPATQQELRRLQEEIDAGERRNAQQRAELQRLEQQLACNWALIRSYELCDQLYPEAAQDHLTCNRRARQNTARCLADIGKPSPR